MKPDRQSVSDGLEAKERGNDRVQEETERATLKSNRYGRDSGRD